MADGSIILDTRVNTKGAEADLKALQAKAKSTAQQIAAVEKDYNSTTSKHSKLGEDLRQTRAQAAAAAREIQNLNRALDDQNDAGLTVDPADIKRLDSMRASLDKQLNQIADMSKEYRSQSAALKTMDQQHKQLTARLEKEQTAVNEQADAEARMQKSGVSDRLQKASSAIGSFAGRLKHIVAGVLVFNLISSALRTMVSGLGSAIVKTDGVSTAFARLKGAASTAAAGLASALAPAISWIMNLLTSLLNGIVRLISFLTGKSISGMKSAAQGINSVGSAAGSTAKKTKDAGKEAKKAAGELAAFDELNVLNKQQEEDTDDDTGGGGGGAGSGLAYDFEQAQNPLKDLMGRLSNFWDAFLARLAPSVAAWKAAWEQIRQAAMDVWPGIQAAAQNL